MGTSWNRFDTYHICERWVSDRRRVYGCVFCLGGIQRSTWVGLGKGFCRDACLARGVCFQDLCLCVIQGWSSHAAQSCLDMCSSAWGKHGGKTQAFALVLTMSAGLPTESRKAVGSRPGGGTARVWMTRAHTAASRSQRVDVLLGAPV